MLLRKHSPAGGRSPLTRQILTSTSSRASSDSIRDFDGRYASGGASRVVSEMEDTPSFDELLLDLSPEEQRTVSVFQVRGGGKI